MDGEEVRASNGLLARKYPKWIAMAAAATCITSGVYCSMVFKWQNKQLVQTCADCEPTYFEGALLQTQLMFIGEFLAIPLWYLDGFLSKRKGKLNTLDFVTDISELDVPMGRWWYWPIASGMDFVATLLINTAIGITYASTVQMLRNFMVVCNAFLQMGLLRKAVRRHEWIGVCLIVLAMILTGIPAVLSPDPGVETTATKTALGIVLAVVGTAVQAGQLSIEEWFLSKGRFPPLLAVGIEGLAGMVYSFVAWPIYQSIGVEDVTGSWYAQAHSAYVSVLTVVYIPAATIFNIAGLGTTKLGSALLRGVCFAVRAPLVWIISLIVKWQEYDHWSLASLFVFIIGFAIYVNLTGLKKGSAGARWLWAPVHCCCTNPDKDDPYDTEEAEARRMSRPLTPDLEEGPSSGNDN